MPGAGAQRVLSLSRDNTIRVWDGKKGLEEQLSISHNNNTGRWTIPFRAVWGPSSDCCLVGNMKRTVRPLCFWMLQLDHARAVTLPLHLPALEKSFQQQRQARCSRRLEPRQLLFLTVCTAYSLCTIWQSRLLVHAFRWMCTTSKRASRQPLSAVTP